jgi:CheY-like chemotaxis protein
MAHAAESSSIEQTITSNLVENAKDAQNERPKILVVDDDPVVRRIVLELLNSRYTVILASTGVQLPDLLQRHHPNLVILDVMLPWVNGFELCRIIKTHERGQETPVLFLQLQRKRRPHDRT